MERVKIKALNEDAMIPSKAHEDDFCYDLTATSVEEVAPNVYKYGTGIAIQYAEDVQPYFSAGFDIRPRSSVWKTGMVLSNSVGTVDQGYTGELFLVFYHVMPNMPKYEVGDRIGQIKLSFSATITFVDVVEFEETERGEGGYGSSGK
jgi:dUTP pyrophosphatase